MPQLYAGYASTLLDPAPGFPMAGMVTKGDRIAERFRDPLEITCVSLRQGGLRIALIGADIIPAAVKADDGRCEG